MRRPNTLVFATKPVNTGGASGVFTVGGDPENDGIIGGATYVALWSGVAEADTVVDILPPQSPLMPMYFDESYMYKWS